MAKERFYSGSREEAIADGDLIDADNAAADAGFIWPLALTKKVFDECVRWDNEDSEKQILQSEEARLVDLLRVCAYTIRIADPVENKMTFEIAHIPRDGESTQQSRTRLEIHAHVNDGGRPCLTIGDPRELELVEEIGVDNEAVETPKRKASKDLGR